ncbi:MarR family winged helix-turn-helix transcriptional regulator [Pimelobacter simplex]|uniref:MarR family transcriptional regulator n=1 Tax=Nocardioides simplex TaxID=2045 RepID=A0A0A1DQC8_NOCSI|nr:MarR family transcriptional regulator [Pimelobacter simplex]AIY19544.1 Transcriptional regulator, MarR family [Pimelobacter simplex]KAB2813008.1 MarR family transcriptional regulator [Pimelobacter simplex]MCG8150790.1 MarR family transcriptional regulator [Pimelobacter simplex]SFM83765.1 DNA-binding transcriptional regulator, MarR family [Pimelobacter simplex]GEB15310.1 MarR family transcriptional regulator [Pimelobacter simplex]
MPDEPHWLTPDELETWQILHLALSTLPGALGSQLQADAELSFLEYYVLAGLSDQPEHTMRMSRLALLAGSELSRLSHLMRRLEKRGLVRREPDPSDGRFTHAILTPAGYDVLVAAAPGHVAQVRKLVIDVLDDEEQQVLRRALRKVVGQVVGDC